MHFKPQKMLLMFSAPQQDKVNDYDLSFKKARENSNVILLFAKPQKAAGPQFSTSTLRVL